MKPTAFDAKIPTSSDGLPLVVLMRDPAGKAGADDGDGMFVSLVKNGANGLRVSVVKADELEQLTGGGHVLPEGFELLQTLVRVEKTGLREWAAGGLARLLGRSPATKDHATTFAANLVPRKLFDAMWEGQDALHGTIHAILASDEVTDKGGAIDQALAAFVSYVRDEGQLAKLKAAKASDLAIIREACGVLDPRDPIASKAGRVISAGNRSTLEAALEQSRDTVEKLEKLLASADADKSAKKADDPEPFPILSEAAMHGPAIKAALEAEVTRLGRALTMDEIATVAQKAMVGEPNADLRRLMSESGAFAGNVTILAELDSAVMKLPAFKALQEKIQKIAEVLFGVPAKKDDLTHEITAAAVPGVREVAARALEVSIAAGRATGALPAPKADDTPAKPASADDPDNAKGKDKDKDKDGNPFPAKKADGADNAEDQALLDVFEGSGLDLNTTTGGT